MFAGGPARGLRPSAAADVWRDATCSVSASASLLSVTSPLGTGTKPGCGSGRGKGGDVMKGRKFSTARGASLAVVAAALAGVAGAGAPAAGAAGGVTHRCGPQTAYVANLDSETVTPIRTRTNKPALPIGRAKRQPSRSPRRADRLRREPASGTVTPIRTPANKAGPRSGRGPPGSHRDHPGRADRLRRQRRSGTVTPIRTATNKAGQGDQVGDTPSPSRSPRTARPPTSPTRLGHGDPDPDRHQQRLADQGRHGPAGHRDHPGREDRLRRKRRLGHGDPDPDRHQHRRAGDQGRNAPRAIAITPDGKTAYVVNTASRAR